MLLPRTSCLFFGAFVDLQHLHARYPGVRADHSADAGCRRDAVRHHKHGSHVAFDHILAAVRRDFGRGIGRNKPLLIIAMFVMGPCTFLLYTQTGPLLWVGCRRDEGYSAWAALASTFRVSPNCCRVPNSRPSEWASLSPSKELASSSAPSSCRCCSVRLDQWWFAGIALMVLGFAGTALLAICKLR